MFVRSYFFVSKFDILEPERGPGRRKTARRLLLGRHAEDWMRLRNGFDHSKFANTFEAKIRLRKEDMAQVRDFFPKDLPSGARVACTLEIETEAFMLDTPEIVPVLFKRPITFELE